MQPVRQLHMNGMNAMATKMQSYGDTQQANEALRGHSAPPQDSILRNEVLSNGWVASPQPFLYSQLPQNPDLLLAYAMPPSISNIPVLGVPVCHEIVNSNLYGVIGHTYPAIVSLPATAPQCSSNLTPVAFCPSHSREINSAQFLSGSMNGVPSPVLHGVQHQTCFSIDKESVHPTAIKSTETESTTSIASQTLDADSTIIVDPSETIKIQSNKGKPKRALTACNLFFKDQRELILAERRQPFNLQAKHDKSMVSRLAKRRKNGVCFEEMGKMIGQRWKELGSEMRLLYEAKAKEEKRRYSDEMAAYMTSERNKREVKLACLQASVSEEEKCLYFSKGK